MRSLPPALCGRGRRAIDAKCIGLQEIRAEPPERGPVGHCARYCWDNFWRIFLTARYCPLKGYTRPARALPPAVAPEHTRYIRDAITPAGVHPMHGCLISCSRIPRPEGGPFRGRGVIGKCRSSGPRRGFMCGASPLSSQRSDRVILKQSHNPALHHDCHQPTTCTTKRRFTALNVNVATKEADTVGRRRGGSFSAGAISVSALHVDKRIAGGKAVPVCINNGLQRFFTAGALILFFFRGQQFYRPVAAASDTPQPVPPSRARYVSAVPPHPAIFIDERPLSARRHAVIQYAPVPAELMPGNVGALNTRSLAGGSGQVIPIPHHVFHRGLEPVAAVWTGPVPPTALIAPVIRECLWAGPRAAKNAAISHR